MKLNYGRTFLIGFAFLSICAFWQLYNNVMPLILGNTFGFDDALSGVVMSADNVIALFLLPVFGAFSDKVNTKIGKRMPFVLAGTALAVILMLALPILDNTYFKSPSMLITVIFIVVLGLLLVTMSVYRSPAVAIMSDLTPKPLRSKANAVINLMGTVGGAVYLLLSAVIYSKSRTEGLDHIDYLPIFMIIAAIMLISVIVLFITVKEPKIAAEVKKYEDEHPEENLVKTDGSGKAVLPAAVKKSLLFMLLTIAFWFFGYNSVDTWFSRYATEVWDMALGQANLCLTVALAVAAVAYIPIGMLSSKFGRKKVILCGTVTMAAGFAFLYILTLFSESFSPVFFVAFAVIGVSYAATIVNTLPMVVEMCKGSDVGKFTGLYYTFSMSAQIATPILSGFLFDMFGKENVLFPYAAFFTAISFVTMLFVKHGDNLSAAVKKEAVK